jgi:hypothetical protein
MQRALVRDLAATRSDPVTAFSRQALSNLVQQEELHVLSPVREAVLIAGAGVLADRARRGTFPDKIPERLTTLRDPFSGQPLKYRREDDGFVVYSVGPEGNFTGPPPGERFVPGQAFFRYPPLPPEPLPRPESG